MQAELIIETGGLAGRRYVIRVAQKFVLGRGHDVSIHIDDDKVSRRHATLELSPRGELYLTDLASRNGTFLQGVRLQPNTPSQVNSADAVEMGTHVLRAHITGLDERTQKERARTQRIDEPVLPREEFELLGEIGRGATGCVYAARQKLLDRTIAIKVLREDIGDDEARERFLREGRVCCRIQSPFVVQVFDIRLSRGRVFLVMELINGPSARDRLAGNLFPVGEALKIGEDVAHGLAAAHQAGVIHRDIKPGNILLSPDGIAKLSDFGIAKDLDGATLTAAGEGLGTLAYVSPEQAMEAKDVDPRTDIYSLGATLYHLICGRPPFLPASARVLLEILNKPPPQLDSLRPDCPKPVVDLIHRMIEKKPEARPPTAELVARQLMALRRRFYPEQGEGAVGHTVQKKTTQTSDRGGLGGSDSYSTI